MTFYISKTTGIKKQVNKKHKVGKKSEKNMTLRKNTKLSIVRFSLFNKMV